MLLARYVVQEHDDMLKTFQDLFPDELLNPELDAFCLDSTLLPPEAAARALTPGNMQALLWPEFALQSSNQVLTSY